MRRSIAVLAGRALVVSNLLLSEVTAQEPGRRFVTIGEGYTATSIGERMTVAWRMFSTPAPICVGVPAVTRLVAHIDRFNLLVASPFPLSKLGIVAVGLSGKALRPVPITVEYEEQSPPVLNYEQYRIDGGPVVPLRAGEFRFRIRTFCSESPKEVVIHVVARTR